MASSRPNFLFFITDQQRYDHVGYFGNPVLKTPQIDSLAHSGSWFPRFHVASPTCMSSRATLMTGRMPSLNGVRFNGLPLDLDSVTFVDLLRSAGYQTALIGKSHIQGMLEAPSMAPKPARHEGFELPPEHLREALRPRYKPADYSAEMKEVWARTPDQANRVRLPYYGFDHVEFCLGHGDDVDGHYLDWLKGKSGDSVGRGIKSAQQTSAVDAPQVYQPDVAEDFYPTRFVEERTCAWLEQHAKTDEPFFVQCSFPDPHHPFTPPGDYWSRYQPEEVDLPASFFTPNKSATPPVRKLWDEYEAGSQPKRWTFPFVTGEAEARDIVAKTYGQIAMIDDAIGAVLQSLEKLGLADNTVICFFSDHGDYLGDHGLMLKGPMHYQSVIRVPFVWRDPDPALRGGRIDSLASILDLAGTVLARAGIQAYNGIQGQNLLPLLGGAGGGENRAVLIECTTQYPYLGFDDLVSVTSLVDERWRLSVWQGCEWGELYDLRNDPSEIHNLWDEAEYQSVKGELMFRLVKELQNHAETSPYPLSVS